MYKKDHILMKEVNIDIVDQRQMGPRHSNDKRYNRGEVTEWHENDKDGDDGISIPKRKMMKIVSKIK
jgi:hypothetical protein